MGYGMRGASATINAKYTTPPETSTVPHLRSIEFRRKRNPQQAPSRNSGNRTSGKNLITFSQVKYELSSTKLAPSGLKPAYASVRARLTAQQARAIPNQDF